MQKNEKSQKNMKEDMVTFSVKMPLYMIDALELMAINYPERYKSRGDVIREAVLDFIYHDESFMFAAAGLETDEAAKAGARKKLKEQGYSDKSITLAESRERLEHAIADIILDEWLDNGKSRKRLLEEYAKVRAKELNIISCT